MYVHYILPFYSWKPTRRGGRTLGLTRLLCTLLSWLDSVDDTPGFGIGSDTVDAARTTTSNKVWRERCLCEYSKDLGMSSVIICARDNIFIRG